MPRAVLLCVVGAGMLCAQPPREFDAFAVRPYRPQGATSEMCNSHNDPVRLNLVGCTLRQLVNLAYHLKPYQMPLSGPAWIDTDRFVVEARTSAPAKNAEMMQMLEAALAARFHMTVHWADRDGPAYLLQVAKSGLKLQPATKTNHCGQIDLRETTFKAECLTLDDFAEALQEFAFKEHPVLNQTGLVNDKRYQFDLQYSLGDDPADGPSMFAALPDQLGLVIKAGKALVHMLVIDRAARLQAN
jgi:uncharacterized protein (TIGR03435 family)